MRKIEEQIEGLNLSSLVNKILILFISFSCSLSAADTLNIVVGQRHCMEIRLANDGTIINTQGSISGTILLDNPTMFYIDSIASSSLAEIYNFSVSRQNDSTINFIFDYTLTNKANILTFSLCGLALAGNDSICKINFNSFYPLKYNFENIDITLKSTTIGAELPYIRMPILWNNHPNPVVPFQTTTWEYRIDEQQIIIFKIFDFQGKMISEFDQGTMKKGTHEFKFTPNYYFSSGVYFIQMETEKFKLTQNFMIIK